MVYEDFQQLSEDDKNDIIYFLTKAIEDKYKCRKLANHIDAIDDILAKNQIYVGNDKIGF